MKEFMKKYGLWVLGFLAATLILTYIWFAIDGPIPSGVVAPDSWLIFWGDLLAFSGVISLGLVAVHQNEKANKTNKEILLSHKEQNRINTMFEYERYKIEELVGTSSDFFDISDIGILFSIAVKTSNVDDGANIKNLSDFKSKFSNSCYNLMQAIALFPGYDEYALKVRNVYDTASKYFININEKSYKEDEESVERANYSSCHSQLKDEMRAVIFKIKKRYHNAINGSHSLDELIQIFNKKSEENTYGL